MRKYIIAAFVAGTALMSMSLFGANDIRHEVKRGETLYGISKSYGVPVDEIIRLNPSARDGVRSGQVLIIPDGESADTSDSDNSRQQAATAVRATVGTTHTIGRGESLYRIARENGVTVEDILRANPELDALNYSSGTVIVIPSPSQPESAATESNSRRKAPDFTVAAADVAVEEENIESLPEKAQDLAENLFVENDYAGNEPAEEVEAEATDEDEEQEIATYNIAVMLPLMLTDENPPRTAEMFTDFYKGLLLAADVLGDDSDINVNIRAYDSGVGLDSVTKFMADPEIRNAHVIIAPQDEKQFEYIVSNIGSDTTFILNLFATRSEAYATNRSVIQANIPRELMYARAIDAFMSENAGKTPVFLSRVGGTADKEDFANELKARLSDASVPYREIVYKSVLTDEDFSGLSDDEAYVFVPLASSRSEFFKIEPALREFKDASTRRSEVVVFGYPEWLTFRGELADKLGELDATVYSRFFENESSAECAGVKDKFKEAYGSQMLDVVPSQGMLGFDTGMFLLTTLPLCDADFHAYKEPYSGLQTSFSLDDSSTAGLVNSSLLLIQFRPGMPPYCKKI